MHLVHLAQPRPPGSKQYVHVIYCHYVYLYAMFLYTTTELLSLLSQIKQNGTIKSYHLLLPTVALRKPVSLGKGIN